MTLLAAAHTIVNVYPVTKEIPQSSSVALAANIVSGAVGVLAPAASGYAL